ncbi:MAG: sulfotransferase [Actinobacteria bacterium]|nr:sulfotransferase [Actinomycetota bacterium]
MTSGGSAERDSTVGSHQLVFIGGLHRSGTSFLARVLGEHPQVSRLSNTGVTKNEGQHLQDVFKVDGLLAGPGWFGYRPDRHLTEAARLATPESAQRLWRSWSPYWDLDRSHLLEKSPPNIVRTRFLQALYPQAKFVIILRHPVPVALATKKWSRSTELMLVGHWVRTHQVLVGDLAHLRAVRVVRYEEMVTDFAAFWQDILSFLDLAVVPSAEAPRSAVNEEYLEAWHRGNTATARYRRAIERIFARRVATLGYDIADPRVVLPMSEVFAGTSPGRNAPKA